MWPDKGWLEWDNDFAISAGWCNPHPVGFLCCSSSLFTLMELVVCQDLQVLSHRAVLYSYHLFIPGLCIPRCKTLQLSLLSFVSLLLSHSSRYLQGFPAGCLEPIFQVAYEDIKLRCITLFHWLLNSHCISCVKILHSLSSLSSGDQDTKGCEAQEREGGEICQLGLLDQ